MGDVKTHIVRFGMSGGIAMRPPNAMVLGGIRAPTQWEAQAVDEGVRPIPRFRKLSDAGHAIYEASFDLVPARKVWAALATDTDYGRIPLPIFERLTDVMSKYISRGRRDLEATAFEVALILDIMLEN